MGKKAKRIRVLGHTPVTVSVLLDVPPDVELTEEEIYALAKKQFLGIRSVCGNGGTDKLLAVQGKDDTIAADEPVVFDDFMEED